MAVYNRWQVPVWNEQKLLIFCKNSRLKETLFFFSLENKCATFLVGWLIIFENIKFLLQMIKKLDMPSMIGVKMSAISDKFLLENYCTRFAFDYTKYSHVPKSTQDKLYN